MRKLLKYIFQEYLFLSPLYYWNSKYRFQSNSVDTTTDTDRWLEQLTMKIFYHIGITFVYELSGTLQFVGWKLFIAAWNVACCTYSNALVHIHCLVSVKHHLASDSASVCAFLYRVIQYHISTLFNDRRHDSYQ